MTLFHLAFRLLYYYVYVTVGDRKSSYLRTAIFQVCNSALLIMGQSLYSPSFYSSDWSHPSCSNHVQGSLGSAVVKDGKKKLRDNLKVSKQSVEQEIHYFIPFSFGRGCKGEYDVISP